MIGLMLASAQVNWHSYEIKWTPSVGQVLRYSCEWGGPVQATDAIYLNGRHASTLRVVSVTAEQVLIEFTLEVKEIRWGDLPGSKSFGSTTLERKFKRNGEPLESSDFLPTLGLRGSATVWGMHGFTFPKGSHYIGTSWAAPFESGEEFEHRVGVTVSTFEGLEVVDGVECFKVSYRALSVLGRHAQDGSGVVWLDRRDGSIVRLLEGERPASLRALGNEATMKLPSYVDLKLVKD